MCCIFSDTTQFILDTTNFVLTKTRTQVEHMDPVTGQQFFNPQVPSKSIHLCIYVCIYIYPVRACRFVIIQKVVKDWKKIKKQLHVRIKLHFNHKRTFMKRFPENLYSQQHHVGQKTSKIANSKRLLMNEFQMYERIWKLSFRSCLHTNTHTHIYVYMHTFICVHTHTHICMCTYIYICMCVCVHL